MSDALLLLSFGGPEGPDDVMPFLRNVTRGRGVPDERLAAVAAHYAHFGGVSPINAQNRALLAAIEARNSASTRIDLPLYWGNRNWHPYLADTVRQMADDGIRRAFVFATSATSSYSACRQYRENLADATAAGGCRRAGTDQAAPLLRPPGIRRRRAPTACAPRWPIIRMPAWCSRRIRFRRA